MRLGTPPLAKHHETHPVYIEGCQPCKWATLYVAVVPGSHSESNVMAGMRQMTKNLHRYRDKRQAGERPRGTTREAMDKSERLQDTWTANEKNIVDNNSPVQVKEIKKTLLNERE